MAIFTITTLNDVVSSTDGLLSLREAVAAAEALPGTDTIVNSPGNGGGAGLGGAVFVSNRATFNVINSSFLFNSAVGGTGFRNGQGHGGAIFVQSGGTYK
ncbi:hypothetical protein [Anabaena sp. PCC 7108]|uniref:hypothetical protein n=1 Tax=Anabaena sp. PCC 7108 TaxID=163908 RepID=UPI0003463BD8|nr:hypothetical protein [Anabaena sp. PCC 7108]